MPALESPVSLNLDKIVVATDFTPESEKALAYANALARQYASRLTLAHVIDLSVATPFPDVVVGLPLDDLRHDSAENMERTLNDLGYEGITAQGKTLEAHNPARAVVELSQQVDADLSSSSEPTTAMASARSSTALALKESSATPIAPS
jgi:nucleotide-binding universal stress UspA family protein